jgi:hypothetical protein
MKIYGELLFVGAVTVSIFIAQGMLIHALTTGIICVLLVEAVVFIKKREEKSKLTCNECFHFMRNDLYVKPRHIGFCCHKQAELDSCKICSFFSTLPP